MTNKENTLWKRFCVLPGQQSDAVGVTSTANEHRGFNLKMVSCEEKKKRKKENQGSCG